MFSMLVAQQLNLKDRTLILGVPEFNTIPQSVSIEENEYNVIGVSSGAKPPYLSLEIERTTNRLKGKMVYA